MSAIKLSRTQVMVVRTMSRQLTSLEKSLDRLNAKEAKFTEDITAEKAVVTDAMDKINESIITYTGGLTLNEVLNPSSSVGAVDPTVTVDETATPTETDVTDELINATAPVVSEPVVEENAPVAPFWEGSVK